MSSPLVFLHHVEDELQFLILRVGSHLKGLLLKIGRGELGEGETQVQGTGTEETDSAANSKRFLVYVILQS